MTEIGKDLLTQLTSAEAEGPFVTFMLNTHVAHQDIEQDQLRLKNFTKEAKKRFNKKYPDQDWSSYQTRIDELVSDGLFWRNNTSSVAIILCNNQTFVHRLSIPVDDQYYVGDLPYLLGIIKNRQFNYSYYILALNRDTIKLFEVENQAIKEIELPKDAPSNLETALGGELTSEGKNFTSLGGGRSKEGAVFHGLNLKDEEVEIDWLNYYQAVDTFMRDSFDNPNELPVYLYGLPENQTMYKKITKCRWLDPSIAINSSPAQVNGHALADAVDYIHQKRVEKEVASYNNLLNRKYQDQFVDIVPAAKDGRISHLFIATSNLIDGYGENPDEEYDRRQLLNSLADDVLKNRGQVFILDQADAPAEKSLTAVLRY